VALHPAQTPDERQPEPVGRAYTRRQSDGALQASILSEDYADPSAAAASATSGSRLVRAVVAAELPVRLILTGLTLLAFLPLLIGIGVFGLSLPLAYLEQLWQPGALPFPSGTHSMLSIGGLIVVLGVGRALVASMARAFRRPRAVVRAVILCREEEPELFRLVDDTAARVGVAAPDTILLHADATCFVTTQRLQALNGFASGRSLALGLPCLIGLDVLELRAVVAHELSHFIGWDLWYVRVVAPVTRGVGTFVRTVQSTGRGGRGSLVWLLRIPVILTGWILSWYHRWLQSNADALNRHGERLADIRASICYGVDAVARSLVRLDSVERVYEAECAARALRDTVGPCVPSKYAALQRRVIDIDDRLAVSDSRECVRMNAYALDGSHAHVPGDPRNDSRVAAHTHDSIEDRLVLLESVRTAIEAGAVSIDAAWPSMPSVGLLGRTPAYEAVLEALPLWHRPPSAASVHEQAEANEREQRATLLKAPLAHPWKRSGAAAVDLMLISIVPAFLAQFDEDGGATLVVAVVSAMICPMFFGFSLRATPGKRCFRLGVITTKGQVPYLEALSGRVALLIPFVLLVVPVLASIGLALVTRRSLVDRLLFTRVIELPLSVETGTV
jgi:Zn-dependent protease with chaperone function